MRSYSGPFKGERLETSFEDVSEHLGKLEVKSSWSKVRYEMLVYEQPPAKTPLLARLGASA